MIRQMEMVKNNPRLENGIHSGGIYLKRIQTEMEKNVKTSIAQLKIQNKTLHVGLMKQNTEYQCHLKVNG